MSDFNSIKLDKLPSLPLPIPGQQVLIHVGRYNNLRLRVYEVLPNSAIRVKALGGLIMTYSRSQYSSVPISRRSGGVS